MTRLTLYGKPGCHLCEDAQAAVDAAAARHSFDLELVDVSIDPVLHRRYGERIPVIEIDGDEAFELVVDPTELDRRLATVAG